MKLLDGLNFSLYDSVQKCSFIAAHFRWFRIFSWSIELGFKPFLFDVLF